MKFKILLRLVTFLFIFVGAVNNQVYAENLNCDRPQVMIVLDRSTSMAWELGSTGQIKWDVAKNAIQAFLSDFNEQVDFGLMMFPGVGGMCEPGDVFVTMAEQNANNIMAQLATPPPAAGGYYTPMAQTLEEVYWYMPLYDST